MKIQKILLFLSLMLFTIQSYAQTIAFEGSSVEFTDLKGDLRTTETSKQGYVSFNGDLLTYFVKGDEICPDDYKAILRIENTNKGLNESINYIISSKEYFIVSKDHILHVSKRGHLWIYEKLWIKTESNERIKRA